MGTNRHPKRAAIQIARWSAALSLKLVQYLFAVLFLFALLAWAFSGNYEPDGFARYLPRPVFHSDPFNAIWFFGVCVAVSGAGLVWLGFEPFDRFLPALRDQRSRTPGFVHVASFLALVLCFVLARFQFFWPAVVAGVLAVGLRLRSIKWSWFWNVPAVPIVMGLVFLIGSHDGRLPYDELNEAGKAERRVELGQILAAREAAERERYNRVVQLLDGFYADINSGSFDAQKYFETNTGYPAQINEFVRKRLSAEWKGCTVSFDRASLKAENIEQFVFTETSSCPAKGSPVPRGTFTLVRIALEGERKLTLYYPGAPERVKKAKSAKK